MKSAIERINLKKSLLYLAFFPFIIALIKAIFAFIFGFRYTAINVTNYGLDAFMDSVYNSWEHVMTFDFIGWLVILAIVYQIYYFITQIGTKSVKTINGGSIRLNKLFMYISVSIWVTYFVNGLHALFFGYETSFFFSTSTYSGFEALGMSLLWNGITFSLIPLLPISLIYIIMYLVKGKKKVDVS